MDQCKRIQCINIQFSFELSRRPAESSLIIITIREKNSVILDIFNKLFYGITLALGKIHIIIIIDSK